MKAEEPFGGQTCVGDSLVPLRRCWPCRTPSRGSSPSSERPPSRCASSRARRFTSASTSRQVLRLREQLVRKTRSVQSQIKSFLLQHRNTDPAGLGHWSKASVAVLRGLALLPELRFCLDLLLDELAHAQEQVRRVTVRLKELAEANRHRKATAVMCSVPGVGVLTAAAFRLELPEPQRFDHDGQVARMAGLAPQVRQSGETRHEGGLLKSGNARLRTVLVEAAWRWIRYDGAAARRYRQLVANTGSSKKAVVAMARRLGVLLWRLSVHGELYRKYACKFIC